ncbi:hypothetical protein [Streptomyces sp. CB03911]|uniref:hypothetical protein n=1 Tax=Streptomycetaceae TaxID=2062 RepID=UPI00093FFEF6|nr:hypothetical protein [Streptomyces sp. CB03911]OKI25130.1 hypothetical protein A6A07_31555 [Streptomyces sp. CB03911]
MTTSTLPPHRAPRTGPDPALTIGAACRGLLVGLLTRPGGGCAALVTLPDGRRAVTTALQGRQARQVEEALAGRLRPPTTATGRQLVRWLEHPLPAELSSAGPADVTLAAVTVPANAEEPAAV